MRSAVQRVLQYNVQYNVPLPVTAPPPSLPRPARNISHLFDALLYSASPLCPATAMSRPLALMVVCSSEQLGRCRRGAALRGIG